MMTVRKPPVWSLAVLMAAPLFCGAVKAASKGEYLVYVGTYTGQKSKGIHVWRLDTATGRLEPLGLAAETPQPSFLAVHPNRRFLYSVSEIGEFDGKKSGSVSAFSIDARTGKLTFINKVPTRGPGPCHLSVDKTGKTLLVANYSGGSVVALSLKPDGSLGEATTFIQHIGSSVDPKRQKGPHAHSINLSADNRFAVVADLGLDEVLVYRFDAAKGTLAPNDPPFAKVKPGAGPRHFAFHPGGKFAYVINEMGSSVTAFSYDGAKGVLDDMQTISTLPEGFKGTNYCAEVQVHPSGRFVYGSNRGHDSIAVFEVDPKKGTLTSVEQVSTEGKTPRNFGIDPTGSFLLAANQDSDNIVVFRIDPGNGRLKATGQTLGVGAPVCVKFVAVK